MMPDHESSMNHNNLEVSRKAEVQVYDDPRNSSAELIRTHSTHPRRFVKKNRWSNRWSTFGLSAEAHDLIGCSKSGGFAHRPLIRSFSNIVCGSLGYFGMGTAQFIHHLSPFHVVILGPRIRDPPRHALPIFGCSVDVQHLHVMLWGMQSRRTTELGHCY